MRHQDSNIAPKLFLYTCRSVTKAGIVIFFAVIGAPFAYGQSCGLTSMQDSAKLIYPPIAKAAHVEGSVVLMTTFRQDGTVAEVTPISGPEMLRVSATTYMKGVHANPYSGPRQCPIVVTFRIVGESVECGTPSRINEQLGVVPEFTRIDLQHVVATSKAICFYSQAAVSIAQR